MLGGLQGGGFSGGEQVAGAEEQQRQVDAAELGRAGAVTAIDALAEQRNALS